MRSDIIANFAGSLGGPMARVIRAKAAIVSSIDGSVCCYREVRAAVSMAKEGPSSALGDHACRWSPARMTAIGQTRVCRLGSFDREF